MVFIISVNPHILVSICVSVALHKAAGRSSEDVDYSCQDGMKTPAAAPGTSEDAMPQVHPRAQQSRGLTPAVTAGLQQDVVHLGGFTESVFGETLGWCGHRTLETAPHPLQ